MLMEQEEPIIASSRIDNESDMGVNSELQQIEESRRFDYIDQIICGELDSHV
jgi:hypothetical protein